MTDEQLSALLRLKRFEQPPPSYFDQLLRDVHRRQRDESLRQSWWKLAAERMGTFFSEHSMGPVSYAGAMAVVLLAGIVTIGVVVPGGGKSGSGASGATLASENKTVPDPVTEEPMLRLQASHAAAPVLPVQSPFQGPPSVGGQPRYVIDARPASYEPSFAF